MNKKRKIQRLRTIKEKNTKIIKKYPKKASKKKPDISSSSIKPKLTH